LKLTFAQPEHKHRNRIEKAAVSKGTIQVVLKHENQRHKSLIKKVFVFVRFFLIIFDVLIY
jgi:hypothetical protein